MLPLAPFHQIAYVTNDFAAAKAMLADRYGVGDMLVMDLQTDALFAGVRGVATQRAGFANLDGVQIELIQPVAGAVEVYAQAIEGLDGFAMRLHHVGVLIEGDRAAGEVAREQLRGAGDIVIDGQAGEEVFFLFTDERRRLGHMVEYVWYAPGRLAEFNAVIPAFSRR